MNRVIKFRAKRERDGAWVYGDLLTVDIHHACVIKEAGCIVHSVDPATVGQYTSKKDSKGADIYEGDLLAVASDPTKQKAFSSRVVYDLASATFSKVRGSNPEAKRMLGLYETEAYTIIGNIHDK